MYESLTCTFAYPHNIFQVAIEMYNNLGYSVYRTVLEYYSGEVDEDAYDMRKALSRDLEKKSVVPLPNPVRPEELE